MNPARIMPVAYPALRDWVFVFAVMTGIGVLSLVPSGGGATVWTDFDKIIHAGLYGLLGFVSARAGDRRPGRRVAVGVLGFAIATVFGGVMEWLQSFVEREPSWGDLAADAAGAAGGAALWLFRQRSPNRT